MNVDERGLRAAHMAVQETLVEFRDSRVSMMNAANGFVIREADGKDSSMVRLTTREGLRIGIAAYLHALDNDMMEAKE